MKDDTQENNIDVQDTSVPSDGDANVPRKDLLRYHTFRMVSVGVVDEPINQAYDIISTIALVVNLAVMIMNTFDNLSAKFGDLFMVLEQITVFFFAVDYMLRIYTAKFLYPESTPWKATLRYIFSFAGIIDLLSFLPFYLPVFFPAGASVFRMFRVARIMRLFRINAYYDSLNVITEVLSSKKQQLLSSVFIILVLMVAASLCMYSVENAAQPDVFKNAFSGIWWASSTLLTVGYGDIYPITTMGKVLGIAITFLGVGMVAIPTGIISAGFVEQYTRLKRIGESGSEEDIKFIHVKLSGKDAWVGKQVKEVGLPHGAIISVIQRGKDVIVPRGNVVLQAGDRLLIGAEALKEDTPMNIQEIRLQKDHEWNGLAVRDLDISRKTFLIMVRRSGRSIIPKGDTVLRAGDVVVLYSQKKLGETEATEEA